MCVLLPYPADVAAYSQPVFALRNPDCAADHHSDWGDPPDSNSAECPTVTGSACVTSLHSHFSLSQGDQSPDDGGSRLLTAHCHPNCPNSGSNCSACSGKGVFTNSKSNLENSLVLKTSSFINIPFSDRSDHSTSRRPAGVFSEKNYNSILKRMRNKQMFQVYFKPNVSGVHPATGLTPPFSIPFFHRQHIRCTKIKINKWKIKETRKTRVSFVD